MVTITYPKKGPCRMTCVHRRRLFRPAIYRRPGIGYLTATCRASNIAIRALTDTVPSPFTNNEQITLRPKRLEMRTSCLYR